VNFHPGNHRAGTGPAPGRTICDSRPAVRLNVLRARAQRPRERTAELDVWRRKVERNVATTLFIVFRNPGPSWVQGLSTRQQPLWDAHAVFMDRLFEEGRIVLGGPYADSSRALVVVEAHDSHEASELFRDDPWARSGILIESDVIEWTVFLDSRRSGR
jgi:uncharacterized protein YciI